MFELKLGQDTDFQAFDRFFHSMGVCRTYYKNKYDFRHGNEPKASVYNICVSQAIFCFDTEGKYMGTVADELGNFEGRI